MTNKPSFPARATGAGMLLTAFGLVAIPVPMEGAGLVGGTATAAGVLLGVGAPAYWYHRGRKGAGAMIGKWERKTARHGGTASRWDRRKMSSKRAMRKTARHLCPSLAGLSFTDFHRLPVRDYAACLGTDNFGGYWVNHESIVVRIAGARSGKTSAMASRIIDHAGPAVVTSTRKDLLLLTAQLRSKRGPLYIFNPAGVGSIASTLKWSVINGCTDMSTAERRAGDMIAPGVGEERETWNAQARRVLAPLLYAAAHAHLPARAILAWTTAAGSEAKKAWQQVTDILAETPEGPAQRENVDQFFSMAGSNDRTRSSIVTTLMPALAWLGNPKVSAIGDAQGEDLFDVADLLAQCGTVYLMGADSGSTGALTSALVAEIAYRAAKLAEDAPGGRLDPALLLALDEAALVCPGPIPRWSMDMGGRGILLDIAVQSRAVMDKFWGEAGRKIILGNAAVTLVGAGCNDPDELAHWEALSGLRDQVTEVRNADGEVTSTSKTKVPVLAHAEIAKLEAFKAIAFNRGPVTILHTPNAHTRRDVCKAAPFELPTETNYAAEVAEKEDDQ
ncbi:MAG: type IV secretory system conjugative DNA transfer family protein [Longispora sp.]|nr:type IV secretory system conjugative DNA transfer family protein [Longispora sp. (in: high G+C Gram-positive bacteria)]